MLNREERRKYLKDHKNDRRLSNCPICGYKSLFYTDMAITKPYSGEGGHSGPPIGDEYSPAIMCEVCGKPVVIDKRVEKLMPMHAYLPYTLDLFIRAMETEPLDEEEKKV